MILLTLALAAGNDDRRTALVLEKELRFADAALAWSRCAEAGPPRDQAYCAQSAARLSPQAADDYAGWSVLSRVRRDYRALGSAAAVAEVQAALDTNPAGPAAAELRRWLVAEALEHGVESPLAASVAASAPGEAPWIEAGTARLRRERRHRAIGLVGAGLAGAYGAVAAFGRPNARLRWRAALVASATLGVAPLALAGIWDTENVAPFLQNALFVSAAVLLARRAPPWLAVLGTLGGLTALAWSHGWLTKLGIP